MSHPLRIEVGSEAYDAIDLAVYREKDISLEVNGITGMVKVKAGEGMWSPPLRSSV